MFKAAVWQAPGFCEELEIKLKRERASQSESTNRAAFYSPAVSDEVEGTAIETATFPNISESKAAM